MFFTPILFVLIYAHCNLNVFKQFVEDWGKEYSPSEYEKRYSIFQDNLKIIEFLNSQDDYAVYGVNEFTDLTREEFAKQKLMIPKSTSMYDEHRNAKEISVDPSNDLPDKWNWNDHGAVTKIKDQSSCGSCWSFSTTGNIEGQFFLAGNELTEFSEEQLVECDNYHDCGCLGGLPVNAYSWLINERDGGILKEEDYPYCVPKHGICYPCVYNTSWCGPLDYCNVTCHDHGITPGAYLKDYIVVPKDEEKIKEVLYSTGPLSVLLDASLLQYYHKGIYNPIYCDKTSLDHAVLLVGYGKEKELLKTVDYWIVKNSWGSSWGENGFFRIVRGKNKCGIAEAVSSAVLK